MHVKLHFSRGKGLDLAGQNILLEIIALIETFMKALPSHIYIYISLQGQIQVFLKGGWGWGGGGEGGSRKSNFIVFHALGNSYMTTHTTSHYYLVFSPSISQGYLRSGLQMQFGTF